jgi:hypothetical protein
MRQIVRQVSAVAVLGLGAHIGARFTYKSTGAILERL